MPDVPLSFVVVDTETTGLDPARDRIIDLGAVRLDARLRETDRLSTLVRADVPVPLAVTRMTGIDGAALAAAPTMAEAYAALSRFAEGALLVAHNAAFDRAHLEAAARRAGLAPLGGDWFDTLEAALVLFPEHDRHALSILAEALGIAPPQHRALPDAVATSELLRRLAARAAGLAAEERGLLEAVRWRPLRILDAVRAAPEAAPTPPVAAEPQRAARGAALTALPCAADGWRAEFDPGDRTGADDAAGADDRARRRSDARRPTSAATQSPAGLAARLPGYCPRAGQVTMAEAVAGILETGGIGLFEAGTGMGKSLAYLLPAAFAGAASGTRVVVSTKTKALQRQLAAHELPLVQAALPPGWNWAVLMGRENYLCRRRLDDAVRGEAGALPDVDRALALAYLVGRTRWGEVDLSALPFRAQRELPALTALAHELRSSRATCLGRHCPARGHCPWRLARSRAEAAHLVLVNHALLLTGHEILPEHEHVIIDEAHLLPAEATSAFSDQIDRRTLEVLGHSLRGHGRQRPLATRLRSLARHATPQQAQALRAGAEAAERLLADLPSLARAVGEALAAVAETAVGSDTGAGRRARRAPHGRAARAPAGPPASADYGLAAWLTPGLREAPSWDALATATSLLSERLAALAGAAAQAAETLPDDHRERSPLLALVDDADRAATLLAELPETSSPDAVLWAEIEAPAETPEPAAFAPGPRWTLTRTPLSVAASCRAALWDRLRGAVLTSATLTVGGSFTYFRETTGLADDLGVDERVFPSPFDFTRQAVLVLEHDPGRDWRPDEAADRQTARLKHIAEVTGGRTLALFTNKRDMYRVAAAVGAHVEDDGVLVLAQGLHGSAAALAEEFRAHPETILLGVDSLWTGQDFPGETLVCLVIAKLPFPPQGPLFHARRQACVEAGVDWFRSFYLPEAVLRFRQGFGRLIRTETDVGVVVVLDHRLTQQPYGRDFLESLPPIPVVCAAPDEVPAVVATHLRRLRPAPEDLAASLGRP
ncbi:MAG TPA: helicase C-terminal domain-containing protein [Thermoleophilia bacterium]|nr:helicase C-terminal domain-containing protein [Thermoleophilia bacterium]